jgi:DUF3037 family protein
MKEIGFYSLVRYVPDVERGETVNVGTILEYNGAVLMKFPGGRERVNGQAEAIRRFETTLERIRDEGSWQDDSEADVPRERGMLASLAHRRFPHFQITEPRQVTIDGSPEDVLDGLSRKLVDEPAISAGTRW